MRPSVFAAVALVGAALMAARAAPAGAETRPGGREFGVVQDHDPQAFLNALRYGVDFLSRGQGRSYRIILAGRGVLLAIPGTTIAQKDYRALKAKAPHLEIIACKETVDTIAKNAKRRVPLIPGVTARTCKDLRQTMQRDGWQPTTGLM